MDWTVEAIDRLRALWSEGHSTAEIGRRMGVSKNAVVGKAHRLNLPARPSPIRRDAAAPPKPAPARRHTLPPLRAALREPPPMLRRPEVPAGVPTAASSPLSVPVRPVVEVPAPVVERPVQRVAQPAPRPFGTLGSKTCCWPIGEPGTKGFTFCTSAAMGGKPYCQEHASIAYVRVKDKREDAA
ncbi:GcrA cell cycle regulator [Rhodovarius crocodyli]|uniref:GcrA cell cycle regulator n=1 Tax=Rhodovarius crocodyli TaxID=1979269 RepID=A0A437MNE0_9PROT|nr:GcrA family cell cycle regulator [Rhodovarius crocodyli]RVT99163.1 GcrA cell cycle regulator [Rhodovarius crocodyli]